VEAITIETARYVRTRPTGPVWGFGNNLGLTLAGPDCGNV
jgi:hypothetical protein